MTDFRMGCPADRVWAGIDLDLAGGIAEPPTFYFREQWASDTFDDLATGVNRTINYLTWDDGPRVGRHPRLGVIDTENMVAEVVTMYHDYPGADQFDQIDARDCA